MKYMGDKDWWNKRFRNRELNIMKHEKLLEEDIKYFPLEGNVLDVASGDGRNAIYLASLGYEVTAIDFSEQALDKPFISSLLSILLRKLIKLISYVNTLK